MIEVKTDILNQTYQQSLHCLFTSIQTISCRRDELAFIDSIKTVVKQFFTIKSSNNSLRLKSTVSIRTLNKKNAANFS